MIITISKSNIRKINYFTFFLNSFSFSNFHNIFLTYFKITTSESHLYILSEVTFSYFIFLRFMTIIINCIKADIFIDNNI
jgi:phosphate starvation-inducible membrane PsiE